MYVEEGTSTPESREAAVAALRPLLRLVARQYCADVADAEDVVQEGLLRFCKYEKNQAADLKAYLLSCIRTAAIDYLKSGHRRVVREQAVARIGEQAPAFECALEIQERRQLVESALAQLPVEQREVIVMKIWAELTFPQIGEATGVSANTAASRYRYGLSALRDLLGGMDWQ